MIKRNFARTAIAMAAVFGFCTLASAQARITLGTNPQGSLYYTIGSGIAAALQESLNRQVTVQPFSGSSVYIPLIESGEVSIGLNSALDVGGMYRGDFGNEANKDMRVLARLFPLRLGLAVRANSGFTDVADLKGSRTVTKYSSIASLGLANLAILQAGGLSLEDVKPITVAGLKQGMDGLTEGTLDATGIAVGIPLTQQAHATIPGGIRYLSITGEGATDENIDSILPGMYLLTVAPSARMPEVTEPVTVGAYDVYLTTSASLSDEDATAILASLYDSLPQLTKDYPPMRAAKQELLSLPTNTVPYHPAAVRFFEERDMWTEDNKKHEASLN